MNLPQVEMQRLNESFDACWTAWQKEHEWASLFTHKDIGMFFNHFPLVLYEYFPHVPLRAARSLALASRAISTYTLMLQMDVNGRAASNQMQAACSWLQAFAHQEFERIIPPVSPFWHQLETSYSRCRKSLEQEHTYLCLPAKPYPAERFVEIVGDKTALAGAVAAALAHLSGQQKVLTALSESQRYLYAGLQLYQHALNWKQDFTSGAFSYLLINLLLTKPYIVPAGDQAGRQSQIPQVGRHFYFSGLAEGILETSSENFCRAMAAVTDLPPNSWGAMLTAYLEQIEELRRDIGQIRRQQMAKVRTRVAQSSAGAKPTAASVSRSEIDAAICTAGHYLSQEQAADGRWGDFMLLAEQSTFWVTGYVGWTLHQARVGCADLTQAARWLIDNQFPDGGWGYNSHWPEDADSIANALLFLSQRPEIEPLEWSPALEVLFTHQRPEGSFTTIVDAEAWLSRFHSENNDTSGWTCSHPCVTAVVAFLLATLDGGRYRALAAQAIDYLRTCQRPEGYWDAYWWMGRFYTTCRAVQAMYAMGESLDEPCMTRVGAWLVANQGADGSWTTLEHKGGQSFHTALAVQALCVLKRNNGTSQALTRGARWLLDHQHADGSWSAVPILRCPAPDRLCPWEQDDIWRESIVGFDVVVPDWRRLFTTATTLQALCAVGDCFQE